jgi:hypothetical protein
MSFIFGKKVIGGLVKKKSEIILYATLQAFPWVIFSLFEARGAYLGKPNADDGLK